MSLGETYPHYSLTPGVLHLNGVLTDHLGVLRLEGTGSYPTAGLHLNQSLYISTAYFYLYNGEAPNYFYVLDGNSWTFSCWFNLAAPTSGNGYYRDILTSGARSGTPGYDIALYSTMGNKIFNNIEITSYFSATQTLFFYYSPTFSFNVWYNLILSRTGTSVTAYINGNSLGTQTGIYGSAVIANPYRVGQNYDLYGYLDEIIFYTNAKSAQWVKRYYANCTGKLM